MTDPALIRAREHAAYEIPRGAAFERGILNGYCDGGSIVQGHLDDILREKMEENIPDD